MWPKKFKATADTEAGHLAEAHLRHLRLLQLQCLNDNGPRNRRPCSYSIGVDLAISSPRSSTPPGKPDR